MSAEIGFAIPGDLQTRTGGYAYDRRLIDGLRTLGLPIRHIAWPRSFPAPDEAALAAVSRSLAEWPDGSTVLIDGLAYGAMPGVAATESARLRLVAVVHHPLVLETGAPLWLLGAEREALRHARAVIATSETTAVMLRERYGVAGDKLIVAPPGTEPASLAPRAGEPPHLLSLGAVVPRKGHDVLVSALARLPDLAWRCTIAGSLERAPDAVQALREQIAATGLDGHIILAGEVADASALFASADLFVLASRHEGYGMAFAEALAHGLPVVGTLAGAIPSVVPAAAGALVPPDAPVALANALRRLLTDRRLQDLAAAAARQAGAALPGWHLTAASVASLLDRLS
jgi:glycosyltransferase involved in cell wall biosynthesis